MQVSKGVGVALWTNKLSSTCLAIFLLIVKYKVFIYGFVNLGMWRKMPSLIMEYKGLIRTVVHPKFWNVI